MELIPIVHGIEATTRASHIIIHVVLPSLLLSYLSEIGGISLKQSAPSFSGFILDLMFSGSSQVDGTTLKHHHPLQKSPSGSLELFRYFQLLNRLFISRSCCCFCAITHGCCSLRSIIHGGGALCRLTDWS